MPALFIIIGAILVIFNVAYILRKEELKGEAFSVTYDSSKTSIGDEKVAAYELREEFSETILELQLEIEALKDKIESSKENIINDCVLPLEEEKNEEIKIKKNTKGKKAKKENDIADSKTDKIKKLLLQNKTVDEISEELSVGKGEVLLIKELYLK